MNTLVGVVFFAVTYSHCEFYFCVLVVVNKFCEIVVVVTILEVMLDLMNTLMRVKMVLRM